MSETAPRIRDILEPILQTLGLFLWDMEFRKEGPRWLVRVYIDKETGVTLDDCEAVSRDFGAALDVEDVIPHAYVLEVSSPGLDRTLSRAEHFQRFVGNKVKLKTFQPVDGKKAFLAEIAAAEGDAVKFRLDDGRVLDLSLKDIAKASLVVEL